MADARWWWIFQICTRCNKGKLGQCYNLIWPNSKYMPVCSIQNCFRGKMLRKRPKSWGNHSLLKHDHFGTYTEVLIVCGHFLFFLYRYIIEQIIIEIIRWLYWMEGVALQVLIVIAWSNVSIFNIFQPTTLYHVSSIFITAAFLRVLQSMQFFFYTNLNIW